ncbi:MAG: hypothetical protein HC804_09075 [Anaerolineae bacterium]|nr:hypothetical protein [Anaerolineae bacterium]
MPYEAIPTPGLLNPRPVIIPDAAHTVPLPGALFSGSYLPCHPIPCSPIGWNSYER